MYKRVLRWQFDQPESCRPSDGTSLLAWLLKAICYADVDVDEKHFVRVDVSEEFPFLVTKMSPYYDR